MWQNPVKGVVIVFIVYDVAFVVVVVIVVPVLVVDPRNLPLKFGQSRVSHSKIWLLLKLLMLLLWKITGNHL